MAENLEEPARVDSIEPPAGLSADALDLFEDVTDEQGDRLTASQFASLVQACRLITLADRAEEQIGDRWIIDGYRGQPIANPLISDARMVRASAVQALKSAGLDSRAGSASAAGAALVGHRWRRR
ncbi:hypothetical protein AB0873_16680 [Micromonospora sp. NPDC047707]|uniref:hypothetical protein n=1 Tax=Micromonospora sp. NPDC047707 TaxID=3154498 RepID=UPI00345183B3